MVNDEIDALCMRFVFYLKTETQLEPLSVNRTMTVVKRLLQSDALYDRNVFLRYCLQRLDDGIDPYTVNKEISAVKHYLNFTGLTWQPLKYFETTVKNVPAPTPAEIEQFLSIHTTPACDMFWAIHTHCGTRPGEVVNLRLKDVDFTNECFRPQKTKTNDGKPIILPPLIAKRLRAYVDTLPAPVDYLFVSAKNRSGRRGRPMTTAAINKDCRKRLKIMGCKMPYTAHSFRHAYITTGIASGVPLQYVQRSVRHAKTATTMQYFDKSVDFAKKAAQAHPFYRGQLPAEQVVQDWIGYIERNCDDRFDRATLQQAFALLYQSITD